MFLGKSHFHKILETSKCYFIYFIIMNLKPFYCIYIAVKFYKKNYINSCITQDFLAYQMNLFRFEALAFSTESQ